MNPKLKKVSIFILALMFILVLAACGSNSSDTATGNATSSDSENGDNSSSEEPNNENSSFPEREVEIIVPNAAGGSNDLVARSISRELSEHLGVSVVVRNEDGAGGSIARSQVYKENPDGYTILTSPMPSMSIGELVKGDDFKVLDFEPIYNLYGKSSTVIAVPTDSPIQTIEELFEVSKEKTLTAAGTGAATNSTLASIIIQEAGLNHKYVPFKGDAGASTQVAGGHVDFGLISETGAEALVKDNQMRVIAYLGENRSELYPDAETLVEAGYESAYFEIIYGFFAPPGTPENIIEVFENAFDEAAKEDSFKEMAKNSGFNINTMDAAEFKEAIKASHNRVEELKDKFNIE